VALGPGTRLGAYEILSLIGSGGMGEVYRAKDTKLNRDVALKILPATFTNDPDRLARFRREAQVLASLNDPHIGAIYGLDEANGTQFLVLELVDGESLDRRIARGPIPVDDAFAIAKQIAEALEAAHEKGIIHRDLKPANIALTYDGNVKVLDFGLAKATEPASGPSFDVTNSPTITTPAMMTGIGVILGTAAYMSPEQAAGKPVDKRSDLWAFGVVLMEMLTGRPVFTGETVSHLLASVLKSEPDWTTLPASTPASIRRLLRRCLEKDRKRRLDSAADARLEIDDALAPIGDANAVRVTMSKAAWQRALPWAIIVALATGLALVLVLWAPWRKPSPPAALRLSTELGADVSLTIGVGDAAAILSPDGTAVAFVAQQGAGGRAQLYVRPLAQPHATPLSGTDGADSPFFSPDGQWIGFFAGGKLKKIAITGGVAVSLCDAPNDRGGAWSEDGTIVFAPDNKSGTSLLRVPSAGGTPALLTSLAEGEVTQRWPQMLPNGKAVLFTSSPTNTTHDDANLVVQPLPGGTRKVVQHGGYHGRYLPSGHLLYVHDGTLFAAPFDLDRLEVTGQPVPALESVRSNAATGGAQFAVSASGALVYLPGLSTGSGVPIYWTDHDAKTTPLRATPANWSNVLFAPDGRRLALQIREAQNDIWVYEWARDTLTRLTFDTAEDTKPVWTPDGRRIVFTSTRADKTTPNLYWQRADGTGGVQRLTESKNTQQPASWHPSGKFLAFEEINPQTQNDLMILPLEGDEESGWKAGKPTVFLNGPFVEREPMFSPDGRWIAYSSAETGRPEVYVRPFPGPGGTWQISTDGGLFPTWSRTKHELFYGTNNGQVMVAAYTPEGDSFRAEKPRLWSEQGFVTRGIDRMFDLHPDGERVALAPATQTPRGPRQDHVTFIFNFFDELRRIVPVKK
jgi:Tol biopolymer transport system component